MLGLSLALVGVIPTLVGGALEKGLERGSLCCVLEESGCVEHEPINGVDLDLLM